MKLIDLIQDVTPETVAEWVGDNNKSSMLSEVNDVFCVNYISKNIWVLKQFYQLLRAVDDQKNKSKTYTHWFQILSLLHNVGVKKCDLRMLSYHQYEIERILFTSEKEFAYIAQWKNLCAVDTYCLLNFIYQQIYHGGHVDDMLQCIIFLSTRKSKDNFVTSSDDDILDILWKVVGNFVTKTDDIIQQFVAICRELYYYRKKKSENHKRLNYILFAYLVVFQKDIYSHKYEVKEIRLQLDKAKKTGTPKENTHNETKSTDYLFMLCEYDCELAKQIAHEKVMKQREDRAKKGVVVDQMPSYIDKHLVDVIKISPYN